MNNLKKWLLILLTLLISVGTVYADSAKQVDFLLSGYDDPTSHRPLSGGKVWTFLDGTSTLSAVWTDKDKGGVATNPVILDSAGKAEIYGDNIYKFVIYDDEDVFVQEITGLEYQPVLVQPFSVDTISDLRLLTGEFENQTVRPLGYYTPGDGGGGPLRIWKTGGSYVDNGGSVITTGLGVAGPNAWVFSDTVFNIKDFGAAVDGVTDDTAVVKAVKATGATPYFPDGTTVVTADGDVEYFLSNFRADGNIEITIPVGTIANTETLLIKSPDADKVTILGADPVETTITAFVSAIGASKNWAVTLTVGNNADIGMGDYALVNPSVGTGDYNSVAGVWKVTGKAGSDITYTSTHHAAAFPALTITDGTIKAIKSVLKFNGVDGLRFEGGATPNTINNFVIEGDYSVLNSTGTEGAHGVLVTTPPLVGGADSNDTYVPTGNVILGPNFGIHGFGEQGLVMSGRSAGVANSIYSSANRKRGFYAEGASIRMKFAVAAGNGEDGFIADTTGYIQCALSKSVGNGLNGYWSTNLSDLVGNRSWASGNVQNGYECRGAGRLSADDSDAIGNGIHGFAASDGGMVDADDSRADGNVGDGFNAVRQAVIDCDNSSSTNNGDSGYESQTGAIINAEGSSASGNGGDDYAPKTNSILIGTAGTILPCEYILGFTSVFNTDKTHFLRTEVTSIGDAKIGVDGVSTGLTIRSDGSMYPSADDKALGRNGNGFDKVVLKDTTDGNYYKITSVNGVLTIALE